jgi:ornithine cyclodeaminase
MDIPFIGFDEMDSRLTWDGVTDALRDGHKLAAASIADGFAYRGDDTLLSRAAWIDGLGIAVKSATILPSNEAKGLPKIHGGVMVFNDEVGTLEAVIDFHLVTKWKTAGDSLLGAKLLARPDSKVVLIVGAGTVARNLIAAYSSAFRDASFLTWNRTHSKAVELADLESKFHEIKAVKSLEDAVSQADIVSCATMSTEPVLLGAWLQAGQHLDLIGAYRPDMREVDDAALNRARVFVDSRETTIGHIGELKIPIASGAFSADDIQGDFYELVTGTAGRKTGEEITLFKNGGGAHLDLMTSKYILREWAK